MSLLPSRESQRAKLAKRYTAMLHEQIDGSCKKRIEEIEGREVTQEEITEHLACETAPNMSTVFLWKGQAIVHYTPAAFTLDGWRDATVSMLRPMESAIVPMNGSNGNHA